MFQKKVAKTVYVHIKLDWPDGPVALFVFIPEARMISISSNLQEAGIDFWNFSFLTCLLPEGRNVVLYLVDIVLGNSLILRFSLFL